MSRTYELIQNYSIDPHTTMVSTNPSWVIAVVRLALPLSYSREKKASVTGDVTEGAGTRGPTLIITDDCTSISVSGSKGSHLKGLSATLKQSKKNYLIEILPGDWIVAWMVNSRDKAADLVQRIKNAEPCNDFLDGLKFVGRAKAPRKRGSVMGDGKKSSSYTLAAAGFAELDTEIYYDNELAEADVNQGDLGRWLAKVGLQIQDLFAQTLEGDQTDNVHLIVPALVELFLGKGAGPGLNASGQGDVTPAIGGAVADGGDETADKEAPFAYLVPEDVGNLLNKTSRSKKGGILAYADLMELLYGVQTYDDSRPVDYGVFKPAIDKVNGNQRYTGTPLMGAYLPLMQDFCNKPLWNVLTAWINPTVNEMYTALRVNAEGSIVPTIILRQIPFTTDVFANQIKNGGGASDQVSVTPFLSLPRWKLHGALVKDYDLGRSDATRCNFVHVYGQNSDVATNRSITEQIVNNPPIRDDLDIQRSGLHAFMATVACREIDQVGKTPGRWIELIADRAMGSHLTLNGTIVCHFIQEPICEGDNVEWDGVVYHIESVTHSASISSDGQKTGSTTLTVTNGMVAADVADDNSDFPVYPGLLPTDLRTYDPGVSIGYQTTSGAETVTLPTDLPTADNSLKKTINDFMSSIQRLRDAYANDPANSDEPDPQGQ